MFKLLVITMLLSAFFMNGCNKTAENSTGEAKKPALLLDVRSAGEFAEDHIPGAINIPNETIGTDEISVIAASTHKTINTTSFQAYAKA